MNAERRRGSLGAILRWGPLGVAILASLALWLVVDHWWPLLPLGYGPRWPWLGLPLVPLCSGGPWRRRVLAALATLALVGYALLGIRFHLPGTAEAPRDRSLRIVSLNAATRLRAVEAVLPLALAREADVLVVVECPQPAARLSLDGYRQVAAGEVCVWSRLGGAPRLESAPRDPQVIGWSGTIARLELPGSAIGPIGIVHLRSVRNELEEFLDLSELLGKADSMEARRSKRIAGSRHASGWFGAMQPRPALVVGDFNLVVESSRFRADWGGWRDTFEEVGRGTGYTWRSRWYGLRIDHVLHDGTWRTLQHEVGPDLGSDHRPLIVTLARR